MAPSRTRVPRFLGLRKLIPLVLAMAAVACSDSPSNVDDGYRYAVPEETGDGWETGHLADYGFDLEPIREPRILPE